MGLGIVLATRAVLAIAGICALFVCVGSRSEQTPQEAHFRWDWKDWKELSAAQSLRGAKLTLQQRKAIASAIADQIRPMMSEPGIVRTTTMSEIKSESELRDAVLDTRVMLIDLNGDGVPEVVARNGELWGNRQLPVLDFSESKACLRIAPRWRSSNFHHSEVQYKRLSRHRTIHSRFKHQRWPRTL